MTLAATFVPLAPANAGTIILEGSDAIGLHCTQESDAGACTYRDEAWHAIGGSDSRPIAVIGNVPGTTSGSHPVVDFATVADAGTLSNYVALYFTAGSGCCEENDALITAPGAESAVSAYLAAGGTIMIENYIGGAAWDFAVGAGGMGNSHVMGVGGGAGGGSCDDGEKVTATGMANGFVQPPTIGCWEHQGYDMSFFAPLGFTKSFFDAAPSMGGDGWSGLLSSGSTVVGEAPEPVSIALLAAGLVGVGAFRRRQGK